jgi:pimeloyl-ACP methyl ester carboxylesterase
MITRRRAFFRTVISASAALPFLRAAVAPIEAQHGSRLMGDAKFVDVNGINTRYFDGGTGTPLVLIHGGQWPATASADGWQPVFDDLAAHFHVYAFDKLGMGYTDNPRTDSDYSMAAIVQHTLGFIQKLGLTRAILAGHSRGALPAARIAVDRPDLVSHLVILDSNTLAPDDPSTPPRTDPDPDAPAPTKESIRKSLMENPTIYHKAFITDEYVDAEFRIAQRPERREAARKFAALRDAWVQRNPALVAKNPALGRNMGATTWWMYETKYQTLDMIKAGRLKAPTMIIWGCNDPTAPYTLGVQLLDTVSNVVERAELHVLNRAGHFVFAEHPKRVANLIHGFASEG